MAPLPIIRRGFGGAHMSHVLYNFDRIYFVDTGKELLGPDGELDIVYILDGLHLNEEGIDVGQHC